MKVLMFGWEFPPHILGGLGTASYGLTKGMALQENMEITFVIPKSHGDEDQSFLKIIGACMFLLFGKILTGIMLINVSDHKCTLMSIFGYVTE